MFKAEKQLTGKDVREHKGKGMTEKQDAKKEGRQEGKKEKNYLLI